MMFKKCKGFTLIELLIVVSLIGVLSGVMFQVLNVQGLRAKSRDAERKIALEEIKTALELYYGDNRVYPASLASLSPTYILTLPTDPSTSDDYCYATDTGAYVLATIVEKETSAEDGPCSSLSNWSSLGGSSGCATESCYGLENSLGH